MRGSQGQRAVAHGLRHCIDNVISEGRYEGDNHDTHHQTGCKCAFRRDGQANLRADVANEGRHGKRGEKPIYHRGYSCQNFECRFGITAHTGPGVLGEIYR